MGLDLHDTPTQDDLQSDQIKTLLQGQTDLARQIAAQVQGQHQLAQQMAEIVLAHQAIVRRHEEEDLPRIERIEKAITDNYAMTSDVREMISTVAALKGGLKVLGWLGTAAKWVASIAAVFALLWALIQFAAHGGQFPPNIK